MDNEHRQTDDFLPASTRGEQARGILVNLLAGAIEVGTGAPGVGSLMSAGYAMLSLVRSNMNDAGKAFADVVAAHADEFKKLNDRVKAGEIERELLNRRLTMTQRAIHEAGRHPNKALREALGAFGARVQITDQDELLVFEVADALSRMTALDYDYLVLAHDHEASGKSVTVYSGFVCTYSAEHLLVDRYPGLDHERVRAVERRLIGLGLIGDRNATIRDHARAVRREEGRSAADPPVIYTPTPLGHALVDLSRRPSP